MATFVFAILLDSCLICLVLLQLARAAYVLAYVLVMLLPIIGPVALFWLITWHCDRFERRQLFSIYIPAVLVSIIATHAGYNYSWQLGLISAVILAVWLHGLRHPLSFHFARRSMAAGHWAEALERLNKAAMAKPNGWEIYRTRSIAHLGLGQLSEAEQDAQHALRLYSKAAIIYDVLGTVYEQQEDYLQAKQAYLESYRLGPRRALSQYNLGMAHFHLGEFVEAEKLLTTASKWRLFDTMTTGTRLQAIYGLVRSQEALGKTAQAQKTSHKMVRLARGLAEVKRLASVNGMTAENLADLERRLGAPSAVAS